MVSKPFALLMMVLAPQLLWAQASAPDTPEPGSVEEIAAATTEARFLSPWVSYLPASASVASPRAVPAPNRPARRASSWTRPRPTPTAARWPALRRACACSPSAAAKKGATSSCSRSPTRPASASSTGSRPRPPRSPIRAAPTPPQAEKLIAERPAHLLLQCRPALRRDRFHRSHARDGLPPGGFRAADDPAHPREHGGADQPRLQSRRPRQDGGVVLSLSEGQDRSAPRCRGSRLPTGRSTLSSTSTATLTSRPTRPPRPCTACFTSGTRTVVHDLHESVRAADDVERHRPLQPEHRSHHLHRVSGAELPRSADADRAGHARASGPGISAKPSRHLYLDSVAMNHNSDRPRLRNLGQRHRRDAVRRSRPGEDTTMEWYRPLPPPAREVTWSARDNSTTRRPQRSPPSTTARGSAKEMLRNFYQKGWDSWQQGLERAALRVPDSRRTRAIRARVAQMVGRLHGAAHRGAARATHAVTLKEGDYPAGTYVVRLDQPYRNYAVDLLTPQHYPKDGGEPYDDVSWELPAHYHLEAIPTADPGRAQRRASLLLTSRRIPRATCSGAGPVFLLKDTGQEELLAARYRLADFKIEIAEHAFSAGGVDFPRARGSCRPRTAWPARFATPPPSSGSTSPAPPPCRTCRGTQPRCRASACGCRGPIPIPSAGSATHSTSARFPTPTCATRTFAPAGLRDAWTSCSTATWTSSSPSRSRACRKRGDRCPSRRPRQTPSLGTPAESDDITGGIGWDGLAELQRFVEEGGLLVTLGSGSMLPLEGGIVRGVRRDVRRRAAQHAGRRRRFRRRGAGGGHAHPGRARARDLRPPRSPDGLRLPGAHPGLPPELPAYYDVRDAGCAWPTAPPASTARRIAAASCSSGATATARRSW